MRTRVSYRLRKWLACKSSRLQPNRFEGVCVVEQTIEHDGFHPDRVADVIERIRIKNDQVRELAALDAPERRGHSDRFSTRDRAGANRVDRLHAAFHIGPHLPVRAET